MRRREILYGSGTSAETLAEYGMAYEEVGHFDEALQFYSQCKDREGLKRMKTKSFELGNAFMLKVIAKALPDMVGESDWKDMIEAATRMGKDAYAAQAQSALEGHLEALEPEEKRGQGKA
jgi:hypothetical protein